MKRIGIVTLYGNFNYGNRLQNYAVIRSFQKWGAIAETIVQKKPDPVKLSVKKHIKRFLVKYFKRFAQKKAAPLLRELKFEAFTKKYIPTNFYSAPMSEELINKYDQFVVGSDQVWNPTFGEYEKQFDEMFLVGVPNEKKACFAPSFGVSSIPSQWQKTFSEQLNTFPKLCAREQAGVEIIKELTGRQAALMIDPTLVLNAQEWSEVAVPVEDLPDQYVLDYFLGETPDEPEYHAVMSGEYGNKRIKMQDPDDPKIYITGPGEFLYLISKASLICTDSFHACVFAILFNKPFCVFKRVGKEKDMFSRLDTLLKLFGVDSSTVQSGQIIRIDPNVRDTVLNQKRQEVQDFFAQEH